MRFVTKRVDLGRHVTIHDASTIAFDPETVAAFHGPSTVVTPWTMPHPTRLPHVQSRTVTFDMPLPGIVAPFFPPTVTAVQTRVVDDTGCVRVNSSTSLGVHPIFTIKFDSNRHVIFEADVAVRAPSCIPRCLRGIAERLGVAIAARDFARYLAIVENKIRVSEY